MNFEVENRVLKGFSGTGNEITIPKGIIEIAEDTFKDAKCIEHIIIPEGVEVIGENAFYMCENLESVSIPSTIRKIGRRAFCACYNLKRVFINDLVSWCRIEGDEIDNSTWNPLSNGADLYLNNSLLEELIIPDGITKINKFSFCNCTSISSLTIHSQITSIGNGAFRKCINLKRLVLADGLQEIGNSAFEDCKELEKISIPDSVVTLGESVFLRCEKADSVILSRSLDKISSSAFAVCKSLTEIEIPENIELVCEKAFSMCSGLKKIIIPSSLVEIQKDAFNLFGSTSREVHIPSLTQWASIKFESSTSNPIVNGGNLFVESIKVTTLSDIAEKQKIEDYSFAGCDGFVELIIPFGMTSIGTGAFQNCKNIRKVSIPESILSIGRNAFENCYGLKEVNISNPKTIIEQNAFMNSGIREIDIPTGNGQIADGIFNRCKNLKKLTIPEGIVSIERNAFSGCGIQEVTLPSTLKEVKYAAFYSSDISILDLPEGMISIEKSAFSNCQNLRSVKLPSSIKILEGEVFPNCKSLEKVTINCNISALTKDTFANCPALNEVYIIEDQVEEARDYFAKKTKYFTLEGIRIGKPEKEKPPKPVTSTSSLSASKEMRSEKQDLNYGKITIDYIDGTKPEKSTAEIIQFVNNVPKGFTKPEVKEVFINQSGKDFGLVFKLAAKLPAIWKRFYLQKDNGCIFDPAEALRAAYQSGGYIDDSSGSYVSCPLQGNIPKEVRPLCAEEVEKRLKAFVTVVNACVQEDIIEKIFISLPKKKNGMLHKGRVVHIGYLDLVDDDGSTFEITAKNEDDSQALIEIRSNVPVVNDLLNQDSLFVIRPDNPLLTSAEYAIIKEEERKKYYEELLKQREAERQAKQKQREAEQKAKREQQEAERQAKLAEREAAKQAREAERLAAKEQRARERAQWEHAKELANLEILERKEAAKRQKEKERMEAQRNAAEAREIRLAELEQARANATILYAPGKEPERIHARIQTLMAKLEEAYPDHVIFGLGRDHKKWGETITELYRQLGYADNRSFLEAYGFTMDDDRGRGGRPVTLDANAIIEELKRRYPDGAGSMKLDELRAANPDLPLKTLQNNANESFGMPLTAYLKSIGLINGSTRITGKSQVSDINKDQSNQQAYNSGNLSKIAEAEQRYLNAIDVLSQRLPIVRMSDISDYLGVSKSSASEALKKLREKGLIIIDGRSIKKA